MDKTQFHAMISLQVKVIYALLSALGLFVIALLDFYEQRHKFAVIAASFALGLVVWSGYLLLMRNKRAATVPEQLLVALLLGFTLFGMHQDQRVVHWIYFVPIYTYFLIPFRRANIALAMYSLLLVAVVLSQFSLDIRWQVLFTYASCYSFSWMYAFINERSNQKLEKIINTDPITQVYNQHQLEHDLNKEMIRADRQHSKLYVLMLAVPLKWRQLKERDHEQKLSCVGQRLRHCLRQYDTCYRLNNDNFITLMPQTSEEEALRAKKQLEQAFQHDTSTDEQVTVHLQSYLPEDDQQTLLERLAQEAKYAR